MSSNDRIILDEVLKQKRAEVAPSVLEPIYFEFFTAEQILKGYDLSYDEIESGIIGNGGDGGIDSIYIFVNGELAQEDTDYSHLKNDITIELKIIQAKTSASFKEAPIDRFISVSNDIFDLTKDINTIQGTYNTALLEVISRFREVHKQLAAKFPILDIHYFYATKGDEVNPNVKRRVERLQQTVKFYFPSSQFLFRFLGASELLELARRTPPTSYTLNLAENPISSEGRIGFVCLVHLREFYKFVTDSDANLLQHIFEANVRDYQGRTEVNDEIQNSLQKAENDDFWWLNNGVTIIAAKASQSAKALTIEDPQIVNGLQTSREIYNYFRKYNTNGEKRNLLVRVIVPSEPASRDRIIKATNSQTVVQPASLRATDKIHRDIEEYFRPRGFFYDRRKNFYKNEGKPLDRIISIPYLAQATMAILLGKPDTARARPSSLLKRDEDYKHVYNPDYPIEVYYIAASLMKRVEAYQRSEDAGLEAEHRNNLRFYVAMHGARMIAKKPQPSTNELAQIEISSITDYTIRVSLTAVRALYDKLGGTDKVAKGTELLPAIQEDLNRSVR